MYKLLDIINTYNSLYSVYITMTLNKPYKEFCEWSKSDLIWKILVT